MTPDDVSKWLDHHDTIHPGYVAWLSEQKDAGQPMVEFWNRLFRGITLTAAMDASEALGVREKVPPFGRHAGAVARLAGETNKSTNKRHYRTPDPKVMADPRCAACGGVGRVPREIILNIGTAGEAIAFKVKVVCQCTGL